MNRTSIDWAQYSWNPVTGCQHGCDYCYARRMAQRFTPKETDNWDDCTQPGNGLHEIRKARSAGGPWKYGFAPTLHSYRLSEPLWVKKPSRIFVCSMADLFGDWVPDDWITQVLAACEAAPWHQYLFLTKNAGRYEELFQLTTVHPNWWLGTTCDTLDHTFSMTVDDPTGAAMMLLHRRGWHTWASAEPLLEDIALRFDMADQMIDWLVIGAMTGPGSKGRQPKGEWVEGLTEQAIAHGVPVFHKRSLASVIPPDLIQWYPKAMTKETP